ncbi:MAG: hypothetical protein HQK54_16805 [Oligoflexales bacterium]|nr:hypothetical protein [Oligoflexales bacterium]
MMDSRTDFYGKELFLEHRGVYDSIDMFNLYVDKYKVNLVMLKVQPRCELLRRYLMTSPGWRMEISGLRHVLFHKINL